MSGTSPSRSARPTIAPSHPTAATAREVVRRADSARSEDRQAGEGAHVLQQLERGALERAVALDCGAQEAARTGLNGALDRIRNGQRGLLRPPGDRDDTVANVDGDDESLAELRDELLEKLVAEERSRSDHDAVRARFDERRGIGDRADASRRLDTRRRRCGYGAGDELRVHSSSARRFQIDDVDDLRSGHGDALDQSERIRLAQRDVPIVTAKKTDRFGSEDVHGRNDLKLTCCPSC